MARDRSIFFAICLVLTVIEANALQCYQKVEGECKGSNEACEIIAPPSQEESMHVVDCRPSVERCFSAITSGTVPNGTFDTSIGSCETQKEANFTTNECYNIVELQEISRKFRKLLVAYETQAGIKHNIYTYCTCNESLCNDFTDEPTTIKPSTTQSSVNPLSGFSILFTMLLTGLSMSSI